MADYSQPRVDEYKRLARLLKEYYDRTQQGIVHTDKYEIEMLVILKDVMMENKRLEEAGVNTRYWVPPEGR